MMTVIRLLLAAPFIRMYPDNGGDQPLVIRPGTMSSWLFNRFIPWDWSKQ